MDAPGSGYYPQDILDYPWLYMYDHGAFNENPEKGNLYYG